MIYFPNKYHCLKSNLFKKGSYALIPIRYNDRFDIMKWRNEQICYLRQSKPLTKEEQEHYFKNVIAHLFDQEKPGQLLFSFMQNGVCIGYGGLVHIDWNSKNAEISFLLNTDLNTEDYYKELSMPFFELIEMLAQAAGLHKIYTYGYDIMEYRFYPLIERKYKLEALLRKHVVIDGLLYNVKMYAKIL